MKRIGFLSGMLISLLLLTACHEHIIVPASCTEPEICRECGEVFADALGHTWVAATCSAPKICSTCGVTEGSALPHTWVDATCEAAKTCSVCKITEGLPLGHDLSAESCTTDQVCSRCDFTIPAPGHKYSDATCTEPKTCSVCKATEGKPLNHNMINGKCSRCNYTIFTLDNINRICSLQAKCETELSACVIRTEKDHNPYDVAWDYGEEYQMLVDACDWSLVFDVDFYKATFPMLAVQYHDDDALLLEHFQTVGIHEGRQGSKDFNVGAYYYNCNNEVYKAFEKNWASYYIYYMLNHQKEASINTVTSDKGKEVYRQYKMVLTKTQQLELSHINGYREEVGADDVIIDAELTAFANFRAYLNSHDGYKAHDWAENDNERLRSYLDIMGNWSSFAENTVTVHNNATTKDWAEKYRNSEKHYNAMVNTKYCYVGCSNAYYGGNVTSQFDVYLKNLSTPMHNPK